MVTQGCELWLPISNDKIKQSITSHIDKVWQKRWDRESTDKVARAILPEVDRTRLNHVKREFVLNLQLMMAILTNHGFFGTHLNKLNKNYDPTCGLCDRERETSCHIYAEWSKTVHFRAREQKKLGGILRWFWEKFYLMHLYDNNKHEYEELKTMSDHRGREGQMPPDNGWQTSLTTNTGNRTMRTMDQWEDPVDLIRWQAQIISGETANGVALDWERPSPARNIYVMSYRTFVFLRGVVETDLRI